MRRLLIAVPIALLGAGCASGSVSTTPANQQPAATTATAGAPSPSAASSKPAAPNSSAPRKAGLGDAIDLTASNGTTVEITVVKIVDPDRSSNEFETPSAGTRYVSVQFQLVDKGVGSYQGDPLADAQVKDASGQTFGPDFVSSTSAGPQMSSSTDLAPGDKALGFITFDVPTGDKVTTVQYNLNSGLYGTTAEWTVTEPATAAPPTTQPGGSPASVVEAYYAAINAHDYPTAWKLGGNHFSNSYDAFVAAFSNTQMDNLVITSVSGNQVFIALTAYNRDGTTQFFSGYYIVTGSVLTGANIH